MAGNALAATAAGQGTSSDGPRADNPFRAGDRSAARTKRDADLCLDTLDRTREHQLQVDYRNLGPGGSRMAESSVAAS